MSKRLGLPLWGLAMVFAVNAHSGEKIGSKLTTALAYAGDEEHLLAWVFFTDKGSQEQLRNAVPLNVVSDRSIRRRLKVRAVNEVVDYTDLPVESHYVDELSRHVVRVRQLSKWFNAASVSATKAQIRAVESLPFVDKLELVWRARADRQLEQEVDDIDAPESGDSGTGIDEFNYGQSLNQLQQINVVAVHNTGNYAQGVIVGVFDNGFRLLTHQSFDTLRPRIIATYDWVDHKISVVPNNPSQGGHGVNTLSTIGGFREGQLIGPAFGATYILARTENDSSETPIEEDNWVAAIEWADSIGVDVTSTSLSYLDYDPPYPSWTWQDMNGNTTVITRAADMAVARGIVVLNSAGNSGYNPSRNTLGAPADGDSVLTVGAVTSSGNISSFSSGGPTTSVPPRIKPDILAQGSSVRVASSSNPSGYTFSSGTSFSCPLSAGVAALIVKARPNATPVQIANALRSTASRASNPNNQWGWGIINAVAAINALASTDVKNERTQPTAFLLEQNYPNPFNPRTFISFHLPEAATMTVKVYDALGREVRTLFSGEQNAGTHRLAWDGRNDLGVEAASGMYLYRVIAAGESGKLYADARTMLLLK